MNNNCNHQNESGNFCSQCGVALKEKCPECGEMEKIGRVVCESVVKKVYAEQLAYVKTLPDLMNYSLIPGSFAGTMLMLAGIMSYDLHSDPTMAPPALFFVGIGMIFLSVPLWFFLDAVITPRMEKNARQKFLKENPEYAEILKKAEEKS